MNIKVGTFNLFQFLAPPFSWYVKKDKFTKEKWKKKTAWIKEQLLQMDCDIVGFQEVFSIEELKLLVNSLGYKYFEVIDKPKTDEKNANIYISTVVAIASKYPIKKLCTLNEDKNISLKFNTNEEFIFSRKPIKATIQIDSKELIAYIFHLKSNRLNEYEYKFSKKDNITLKLEKSIYAINENFSFALKQRLMEALHLAKDIQEEKNPYIIAMGDLNDKENSLSLDILTNSSLLEVNDFKEYKHMDLGLENYMNDSYFLAKTKDKREATSYYKNLGNVLDYILVSNNLEVLEYKLFNLHLKDNKDGSLLQSDHAQVTSTISF